MYKVTPVLPLGRDTLFGPYTQACVCHLLEVMSSGRSSGLSHLALPKLVQRNAAGLGDGMPVSGQQPGHRHQGRGQWAAGRVDMGPGRGEVRYPQDQAQDERQEAKRSCFSFTWELAGLKAFSSFGFLLWALPELRSENSAH